MASLFTATLFQTTMPSIDIERGVVRSKNGVNVKKESGEFWTAKQRQAHSLHEISYRACFKAQLPNYFIEKYSQTKDIVFDPFTGRGTTILEAALMNRNVIANDVNPVSEIFCKARLSPPSLNEIQQRLNEILLTEKNVCEIDLTMFYHEKTLQEILPLKNYFIQKKNKPTKDAIDLWIQMIATNRLTGHSKGFFFVYTLPPNQAIAAKKQLQLNIKNNLVPEYRNVKEIILRKSKQLLKDLTSLESQTLKGIARQAVFLNHDAAHLSAIKNNSVQLSITSPPFLDVIQYADDNWLRAWFNDIDMNEVEKKITMSKSIEQWVEKMTAVFHELFRITKPHGYLAFEVGEVRNGKIKLDEYVVDIGITAGFEVEKIIINTQQFTKTSNIWGVKNNSKGTNSNRIVIFKKN